MKSSGLSWQAYRRKISLQDPPDLSQYLPSLRKLAVPHYEPVSDKAQQFHDSPAKVRYLPGGNQSGKSYTGAQETLRISRALPEGQGIACTTSYEDVGKNLWKVYKEQLAPGEIYAPSWLNSAEQIPKSITFRQNNFKLYFGSYEQGREKHQGSKWDVVHLDEECPHDIYIELYRGTLRRHGRIVYTMTPLKGITYVTSEILKKCRDPENHNYWTPDSPMTPYENKHLDPEEIKAFEEELDEKSIQSRIHGYAVSLKGLVYDEFSYDKHVIDPFPIPDEWDLYRGIDFGWEHPTTSILCAYDGYTLYVVSEYYKSHRYIETHAQYMKEQVLSLVFRSGPRYNPPFVTVADHDAQERAQYEREGILSNPAQKKVVEGIAVMRKFLKVHSDGHTRLKIFKQCTHTIEEFGRYHYPGEDAKGMLKPGEKADEPVKDWDHCLDPLRYIAVQILGYIMWDPSGIISG